MTAADGTLTNAQQALRTRVTIVIAARNEARNLPAVACSRRWVRTVSPAHHRTCGTADT